MVEFKLAKKSKFNLTFETSHNYIQHLNCDFYQLDPLSILLELEFIWVDFENLWIQLVKHTKFECQIYTSAIKLLLLLFIFYIFVVSYFIGLLKNLSMYTFMISLLSRVKFILLPLKEVNDLFGPLIISSSLYWFSS